MPDSPFQLLSSTTACHGLNKTEKKTKNVTKGETSIDWSIDRSFIQSIDRLFNDQSLDRKEEKRKKKNKKKEKGNQNRKKKRNGQSLSYTSLGNPQQTSQSVRIQNDCFEVQQLLLQNQNYCFTFPKNPMLWPKWSCSDSKSYQTGRFRLQNRNVGLRTTISNFKTRDAGSEMTVSIFRLYFVLSLAQQATIFKLTLRFFVGRDIWMYFAFCTTRPTAGHRNALKGSPINIFHCSSFTSVHHWLELSLNKCLNYQNLV